MACNVCLAKLCKVQCCVRHTGHRKSVHSSVTSVLSNFLSLSIRSVMRQRPCGLRMERVWWKMRRMRKRRAAPPPPGTPEAKPQRRRAEREAGWREARMSSENQIKPDRLKLAHVLFCYLPLQHDYPIFTHIAAFFCKVWMCIYTVFIMYMMKLSERNTVLSSF